MSYDDDEIEIDMDDLIGGPSTDTSTLYEQEDVSASRQLNEILTGVSVTFLMQAFRMERITVRKRLAGLVPIRMGRGNSPLYDFVQAASYLVKPRVDIKEYIRSVKPDDLPPELRREIWDAKLKQQRWEEKAGDLWRTDDVFEVMGEAFKTIKTTVQLWSDNIERATGLSQEQRKLIMDMSDALLDEIHRSLVKQASEKKTLSQLGEDINDAV